MSESPQGEGWWSKSLRRITLGRQPMENSPQVTGGDLNSSGNKAYAKKGRYVEVYLADHHLAK